MFDTYPNANGEATGGTAEPKEKGVGVAAAGAPKEKGAAVAAGAPNWNGFVAC